MCRQLTVLGGGREKRYNNNNAEIITSHPEFPRTEKFHTIIPNDYHNVVKLKSQLSGQHFLCMREEVGSPRPVKT